MKQRIALNLTLPDKSATGKIHLGKFHERWVYSHALINLLGLLVFWEARLHLVWLSLIGASFIVLIIDLKKSTKSLSYQPLGLGYPNLITAVRLIFMMLLAFYFKDLSNITLFVIFNFVILLDGLDGFIARKLNQCSEYGERFDSEADAQLVYLLSWIHFANGTVDWWILIPGMMRYLYQLFFFWVPSNSKFPPKKFRATVAVIFFFSLSFAFILNSIITSYLLIVSSSLISLSFSLSLISGFKQYSQSKNQL